MKKLIFILFLLQNSQSAFCQLSEDQWNETKNRVLDLYAPIFSHHEIELKVYGTYGSSVIIDLPQDLPNKRHIFLDCSPIKRTLCLI